MLSWTWLRLIALLVPFCKVLGISVRRRARSLRHTLTLERLEERNPASSVRSGGPEEQAWYRMRDALLEDHHVDHGHSSVAPAPGSAHPHCTSNSITISLFTSLRRAEA